MITTMATEFQYLETKNMFSIDLCDQIVTELLVAGEAGSLIGNKDEVKEQVIYAPLALEAQLLLKKNLIENMVGHDLHPSFSFLWVYKKGAKLPKHTDRGSVDIVVTINLRSSCPGEWPLYVTDKNLGEIGILTDVGDAIVLSGKTIEHWRNACPLEWRLQAQLCYTFVNKEGPNVRFDGRDSLGLGPIEDVITTPVQKMKLDIDTFPFKKEYSIHG